MEILAKCQQLYDDMEELNSKMEQNSDKQSTADNVKEKEKLWAEEFNLCMQLSSIYEDLMEKLDELEQKEQLTFVANRLRKKANLLNRTGVINVE